MAQRMLLLTIECSADSLTPSEVQVHYGLEPDEMDPRYGVIQIDDHAFSVRVTEGAFARMREENDWKLDGPFADPEIGPLATAR